MRRKSLSRFLAVLLAAALAFTPLVPANAAAVGDFSDVSSSDWFYGAVDFVVSRGLFTGSSATMFNPNGRMTRGMFITVLGRYANVDPTAWLSGTVTGSDVNLRSGPGTDNSVVTVLGLGTDVTIQGRSGDWYQVSTAAGSGYVSADYMQPDHHSFADVDYSQYYAGYAVWAFEKGIVNGNGSADRFTPDSNITREQMCAMLDRFVTVMGISVSQTESAVTFPDAGSISDWAANSVSAMQRAGVVKGDEQGNFRPKGSATRAETATMLQRFDSACGGFTPPSQDPPDKVPQPGGDDVVPPDDGGDDVVPPDDGGDDVVPPDDGGDDVVPPDDDGGDDVVPPDDDGGDDVVPPDDDGGDDVVPPDEDGGDDVVPPDEDGGDDVVPPDEDGGDDVVPPEDDPSDPNSIPDTPASLIGGSVGVKAGVVRVGVLVATNSIDTAVQSVTLYNLSGSGFDFGAMYDRQFSAGGVSTAESSVTVFNDGVSMSVSDSTGVIYTTSEPMGVHPQGGRTLTQVNGEYKYYGDFELRLSSVKSGYIDVINYVGIEDYVKGVLPFEFSNGWPEEAMKAAAIVCRSYVMSYDWGIYSGYGMDIPTGSGTQIYRGRGITYDESYYAYSDAAVDATSGQYLTYNGSICITAYSSCDGGATRSSSEVFGTSYPYLVGKTDPYEAAAIGDIGGSYSQWVSASHKVGMSAWGCYAMAKYYGKSCEAILGFYYTGTNLQYGA